MVWPTLLTVVGVAVLTIVMAGTALVVQLVFVALQVLGGVVPVGTR